MSDDVKPAITPEPPPAHRQMYSCECGFNVVDDTGDFDLFFEEVTEHKENCALSRFPVAQPVDEGVSGQVTEEQLVEALRERDGRESCLSPGQELHVAWTFIAKAGLAKQYIVFRSGALEAIH